MSGKSFKARVIEPEIEFELSFTSRLPESEWFNKNIFPDPENTSKMHAKIFFLYYCVISKTFD